MLDGKTFLAIWCNRRHQWSVKYLSKLLMSFSLLGPHSFLCNQRNWVPVDVKPRSVKPITLSVQAMAPTSWSSAMTNNDSLSNLMAVYQNVTIYLKQLFTEKATHGTQMHSIEVPIFSSIQHFICLMNLFIDSNNCTRRICSCLFAKFWTLPVAAWSHNVKCC